MDITEIGHKANSRPITNRLYQLDAEEFNAMLDELVNLRSLVGNSGVVYQVRIQNDMDSRNIAASVNQKCFLNFTYISRMRDGLEEWESTGESATLTVSLKNVSNPEFTVVHTMKVTADEAVSLDVSEWLASGTNQIMLEATGEISKKTTSALAYTVQLTSLSISAEGFQWWTAFSGDISIPYRIGGNISKTLVVTISGSGYSKTYEQALGTGSFMDSPYTYTVPHPKRTGVFKISAYVRNSDGTIKTSPTEYNVICYLKGATTKLMAINNVAAYATNWNETQVFDYCVFEGDATITSTTFKVTRDRLPVFQQEYNRLATNTKHTLILPLEIETVDDRDFNIVITAYNGEYTMSSPITMRVSNSLGYSPSAGASLYINPKTRSNSASNRLKLVNEITGEEITPNWRNMNWFNDGHTQDEDGNSVMRLIAGSFCDTGIKPLKPEPARAGKLFETEYKISNVTDFDTPVIQCVEESASGWVGLKVYPDRVVVHSASLKTDDDQSFKFNTTDRIHLALAIMPDIYGTKDFNVCILYVNGVKNREFSYPSNDYFLVDSNLQIGSDYADVDIYGIRVYDFAVSADGLVQNYTAWRSSNDEKKRLKMRNDLYDASGLSIDIEKVKQLCNVVVFEGEIPSYTNPNKFRNNWYIYWRDHPEWNIILLNIPQDGQGTSSKFYYLWNQRGKSDKDTVVIYADGTTGKKYFIFIPGMPAISKFTWKLNWASSCQCNKMGSVNSINDMATLLGILDEAKTRPSIYQEPFVGFHKTYNEEGQPVYTLLGLYTGGPDKSDSGTMGMDTDTYPELLFVEGADNGSKGALFKAPWNKNKPYFKYDADEESLQYNGENAWDYDGGEPESQAEVQALYEKCWMPRYNFVYQCSPHLTYWSGTVESLNSAANILAHRDDDTEFWVDGGNVYYYEAAEGKFVPSDIGNGTINLYTQLVDKGYGLTSSMTSGKTGAQLNDLFRAARIMKFNLEAPSYFSKRSLIFTRNWIEYDGGTDNRTKNTYFFMLGPVSAGYLCYCKHDDTDTIGPWTNQGQDKKGYWIEVGDKYDNGGPVYNGEQNRLFNLVELAWPTEIKEEMHNFMDAQIELSQSTSGNYADKLYAFFHKYYFAKAQEYFPEVLYNTTAKLLYETAKLALIEGRYENDTDPMSQSMGNYYSGWKRWITYRIQYMQSKYSYGDYSSKGTGHIIVRAAGNDITYDITPAIWMYPNVATGTSIIRGTRTRAGETSSVTISLGGAADQQNQIKGAHYLQSIGEWHNKNVTGTLTIVGRMLRELRIGHPTANIVISITALNISETPSMQLVDVRRVSTLGGTLDLSACTHLQKVYASGSSVAQIKLPAGGPLQHVEFSSLNQYLILRNFPLLTSSGVIIADCLLSLTDVLVENCAQLDSLDILLTIMRAQLPQATSHALRRVRVVGFDSYYEGEQGTEVMDLLAQLASGRYVGLDSSGLSGSEPVPVLDGKLTINASVYQDAAESLRAYFKHLVLDITGGFYIRFEDDNVMNVLLANNVGDGVGITKAKVEAVSSIGTWFNSNKDIQHFNELVLFSKVTSLSSYAFRDCSNLKSIDISNVTSLGTRAFEGCSSLDEISIGNIVEIGFNAFCNCTSLLKDFNLPNLSGTIGDETFKNSGITSFIAPNVTEIKNTVFINCPNLTSVDVRGAKKTGGNVFSSCKSLKSIMLNNAETIGGYQCYRCTSLESAEMNSVTRVAEYSFYGCSNLQRVSILSAKQIDATVFYGCKSLVEVKIEAVESLGNSTFNGCSSLKGMDLSHVTNIGNNTFYNCTSFSGDVSLAKLNSSIGNECFHSTNIDSLTAPLVTSIGNYAFRYCANLTHVDIGSENTELTSIGTSAFGNCTSLDVFVCRAIVPPSLANNIFDGSKGCMIYVPDESVEAYKNATQWKNYATRIKPLSEYEG